MNAYVGYAEEPLPYFRKALLQFILGWLIVVRQFRPGVEPTGRHRLFRYLGGVLIIVFINPVSAWDRFCARTGQSRSSARHW
jgi:hypothetical protein